MKKVLTVLMAVTMVMGFAAMASADPCGNCAGTAGNINRGCETGQVTYCTPFDFENCYDYCDTKNTNRALFRICDCIETGEFETVVAGDVMEVSMEILVDKGAGKVAGDNGVYWAENVNGEGIGLGLYDSQEAACADVINEDQDPRTCPEYAYGTYFTGLYDYWTAAGVKGTPYDGNSCVTAAANRVVKITPAKAQAAGTYGYVVQDDDELFGNATWAIDIPEMRVDTSMVNGGEKVWVKICVMRDCSGLCNADEICCCEIFIGTLCCDDDTASSSYKMVYPYFPKAGSTYYDLNAFTVTNLTDAEGALTITMYESDGDIGTASFTVDARDIFLRTLSALVDEMTVTGTGNGALGDGDTGCYLVVSTNFSADGFAMIANTKSGASMGYLPRQ